MFYFIIIYILRGEIAILSLSINALNLYFPLVSMKSVVVAAAFMKFFPGRVGCGMGLRWLSRFKLIRLWRISLATLPRYGWRDGY